jgi:hypothetical protein
MPVARERSKDGCLGLLPRPLTVAGIEGAPYEVVLHSYEHQKNVDSRRNEKN